MKIKTISILLISISSVGITLMAQPSEKEKTIMKLVDELNQKIDHAVVSKDMNTLQQLYADDFVFTHGGGLVESKASWIKSIQDPDERFISREHDSTLVELHSNIAIVKGRLLIAREDKGKLTKYCLWYLRVYDLRKKKWQLVSHYTTGNCAISTYGN